MKVLTDKDFEKFQADARVLWKRKLLDEYSKQREMVRQELGDRLEYPMFKVVPLDKLWGQWSPSTRTIMLNEDLFKHFPWAAVVHVLKHEMAHQVVTEILDMDCYGVSHGEAWQLACTALQVDPKRCVSYSYLQECESSVYDSMAEKVEKLFALGESNFTAEAEAAVTKAYELMERHKIRLIKRKREGETWISRPVGMLFKKMPTYVWKLARIMSDYYNVRCIQCHYYGEREEGKGESYHHYRYMEMFGEPHNLDVAEYVFNFLLLEGERQWKEFKKSEAYVRGHHGKVQWLREFMNGFDSKINCQKRVVNEACGIGGDPDFCEPDEDATDEEIEVTAMVYQYDKVLEDNYHRAYPNMRNISYGGGYRTRSGSGGYAAGQNTSVRRAVRSGGGKRRLRLSA
jgi:hypothetical protein